jgi:drug/metabolite transporter (DMT)-like permease
MPKNADEEDIMKTQHKAYLFAGLAIFFWSTVASAFKIALGYLDYVHLLLFASLTSTLFLFILLVIQGKLRKIWRSTLAEIGRSMLLGLLSPFLYYLILFKAYSLLPAQVAQPLNMVWPIVLVFLSVPLLKHKVSRKSYLALVICFIGVYFVSSQGGLFQPGRSDVWGVILAVGSSLIWSFFFIYNVRDKREEEVKLFLNFFFASIFILIYALLFSELSIPPWRGILPAIYAGIFEMGITFVLWLKALRLTKSADQISIFVYLAPFISLIFIHIFVGEQIFGTTIIGLTLIVGGIIFQKLRLSGEE